MKAKPEPALYFGLVESPETLIVFSHSKASAERLIFEAWKKQVYPRFAEENKIRNFKDLNEWNGAYVCAIPQLDKAYTWHMMPDDLGDEE
jgi:hypothetical protein